jgi:hypothetical protein
MRTLLRKLNRQVLKGQLTVDQAREIVLRAASPEGRKHQKMKDLARQVGCTVRSAYRWGL